MSSPTESAARLSTEVGSRRVPSLLTRVWAGFRLRDAVVITALPLVVVLLFVGDAALRYYRAIQFDDWWSERASVAGYLSQRVHTVANLPALLRVRRGLDEAAADAAVIRFDIPSRAWDSMESNPLAMWGDWIEGDLRYGGTTIPVRLRKRGDNSIHWLTEKRTVTVRTPRHDFYKRYRTFGLSTKDVLTSFVANRLAVEAGLLAPATALTPVFLNNEYYGIFRFIEVVDESFLRPFDRMPGNIFRGDAAERGDYFKGVPRNLFDNPYIWDRVALNQRWTSAGAGQLRLLLEELRGGGFADHQRLMRRLDRPAIARLLAYLLVVGDPYHMDGVHNQFIYEDPTTQLLLPIPWDVRLLDLRHPEGRLNDLFKAVLSEPAMVDQVMREVARDLDSLRLPARGDSLVRAAEARFGPYLRYDRLREGIVPAVGDPEVAIATLDGNQALLRQWIGADTVAVATGWDGRTLILDLEARGLVGADLTGLDVQPAASAGVRLVRDADLDGALGPGDRPVPLRPGAAPGGGRLEVDPVGLLPGWDLSQRGIRAGRMAYRFFVTGLPPGAVVRPRLANRVTGAAASQVAWAAGDPIGPGTGWHPWRAPVREPRTVRWSGVVRLAETVRIPEGDTLVIAPGTTLRLAPDVSVVSRGLVRSIGTADRPIRVIPDTPGRPWGTFSLLGHGADGSVVRNTQFIYGGGALVDRIEYIGMINLHQVDGAVFDSVLFQENVRSDDTFHALHADVVLSNSRFIRANSDAVDFDIATGTIINNYFNGVGGDAVDLMTSSPRVIGNRIVHAGDKGISIGEASHGPFVFGNRVDSSNIGIEIKDRSDPVIVNNESWTVRTGLRERLKNWRYGGSGWATILNTTFQDTRRRLDADSLARFTFAGVVGIDTAGPEPEPVRAPWLLAAYGIEVDSARVGLPGSWRRIPARPPIAELRFDDDFESVAAGWTGAGGTTRLEQRREALVMEVEARNGRAERPVAWDLATGGVLVAQVAGRDAESVRLVAIGPAGPIARDVPLDPNPGRFRLVVLNLPPGRYTSVRLEVTPRPGLSHLQRKSGLSVLTAAQVRLRGITVYPVPTR